MVLVVIAIGSATIAMSMRDPASVQLEREASRLITLLEAARSQARTMGVRVLWKPTAIQAAPDGLTPAETSDFVFVGLPEKLEFPRQWLDSAVKSEVIGAPVLVLGPEPVIGPQRLLLRLGDQRLILATDGLGAFQIEQTEGSDAD